MIKTTTITKSTQKAIEIKLLYTAQNADQIPEKNHPELASTVSAVLADPGCCCMDLPSAAYV